MAIVLPLRSAGAVDVRLDDEHGAARGGAGDDPQRRALRLREAVDRRVGADVGGVDRVGEQGVDGVGAGVERRRLERDVRAELVLGEDALVDADERRGVGDVREVAEPQRDLLARTLGPRSRPTSPGTPGTAAAAVVAAPEEPPRVVRPTRRRPARRRRGRGGGGDAGALEGASRIGDGFEYE